MIIFKKREEKIYLITNYKVMFSTLSNQSSLVRLYYNRSLFLKFLFSRLPFSKYKFYLLVRDPFNRIESFYKDKFLRAENNRLWRIKTERALLWEESTQIFFPYIGLNTSMDSAFISKKLSSITFNKVISILPEVFMKDGHLIPQFFSNRILVKKLGVHINIPIKKVYKLESKGDLTEISNIFNIDLENRYNSSNNNTNPIEWSNESVKIVENIYDNDFKNYNYKKRS